MRSNFITGIATIISKLLLYFFLPLPFVLLGCILFFYDPLNAMPALPFLVFGWGILACSLTVIQLRQKSLIVLFLMIFIVLWHAMAAQLLTERINTFGIIDFQSDDTAYIESATDLANTLKASSKNLSEAWNQVCLGDEIASASLRAHPFTLAYLFCLSENYFNLNYSIAVVINILVLGALYLSICKAALFIHKYVNILHLSILFFLFSLGILFNLSQARKDVVLTLVVSLSCLCVAPNVLIQRKIHIPQLLILLLLSGLFLFIRPVYIVLPVMVIVLLNHDLWFSFKKTTLLAMLFSGVAIYFYMNNFMLRDINLLSAQYAANSIVKESGGYASMIYNIPLIGPLVYFLFTPFPAFSTQNNLPVHTFMQSFSSVVFAALFIVFVFLRLKHIWQNQFAKMLILFLIFLLFITDLGSTLLQNDADPRYKLALIPCICLLAYAGTVSRKDLLCRSVVQSKGNDQLGDN